MNAIAVAIALVASAFTHKNKTDAAVYAVTAIPAAIQQNAAVNAQTNQLRQEIRDDIRVAIKEAAKVNVVYDSAPIAANADFLEPEKTHYRYVDAPRAEYLGE